MPRPEDKSRGHRTSISNLFSLSFIITFSILVYGLFCSVLARLGSSRFHDLFRIPLALSLVIHSIGR